MSDRTLVERARAAAPEAANGAFIRELGDRIAELEMSLTTCSKGFDAICLRNKALQAEVDRLKAALRHIATTADIGLNIGPVIRMAKAALAPAEGEGR